LVRYDKNCKWRNWKSKESREWFKIIIIIINFVLETNLNWIREICKGNERKWEIEREEELRRRIKKKNSRRSRHNEINSNITWRRRKIKKEENLRRRRKKEKNWRI
jgi:hypothetical protein